MPTPFECLILGTVLSIQSEIKLMREQTAWSFVFGALSAAFFVAAVIPR